MIESLSPVRDYRLGIPIEIRWLSHEQTTEAQRLGYAVVAVVIWAFAILMFTLSLSPSMGGLSFGFACSFVLVTPGAFAFTLAALLGRKLRWR